MPCFFFILVKQIQLSLDRRKCSLLVVTSYGGHSECMYVRHKQILVCMFNPMSWYIHLIGTAILLQLIPLLAV